MSDERVRQQGTNQSSAGDGGLYNLRDAAMGGDTGDVGDNTYSVNAVRDISFQQQRKLQGTGTTFFYTYGRNSQQQF